MLLALLCLLLTMLAPAAEAASAPHSGARLELVRSRSSRRRARRRPRRVPGISRRQKAEAQQLVLSSYELGKNLPLAQRVALLSRLLYTLPPTVMADEKRQWAEELFHLARRLPEADTSRVEIAGESEPAGQSTPQAASSLIPEGFREQSIATAAARLSLYDVDRALDLLDSLPSAKGGAADARTMAARLVFAVYLQRHGGAGAERLLASARRWSVNGGFPYAACGAVMAALRQDENASEEFFRQVLAEFRRRQERWYEVRQFAGLLERAVALEAISEESAEEAGRAVVEQMGRLARGESPPGGPARSAARDGDPLLMSDEEKQYAAAALADVHLSAPQAYGEAKEEWPKLTAIQSRTTPADPVVEWRVDPELQQLFSELASVQQRRTGKRMVEETIDRSLQAVNARYTAGAKVEGKDGSGLLPDTQSWALVSLSAYGSPMTIGAQLKAIEEPYWRAYFLAIAAQQVGQPTRVADPTAHYVPGTAEAEAEADAAADESSEENSSEAPEADTGEAGGE